MGSIRRWLFDRLIIGEEAKQGREYYARAIRHSPGVGEEYLREALNDAVLSGRLKKGDLILLASVGAGFTVGSVLVRWGI